MSVIKTSGGADAPFPLRQIRAAYDAQTITVYQAYPARISDPAVKNGRFVSPFKMERMTWIKPSFLWMMYRCGWAQKPDQERVLAIQISRAGFEWALANAVLSHYDAAFHTTHEDWSKSLSQSPVRIQWDPERDFAFKPLDHRSLQLGISGPAVESYVKEWTVSITCINPLVAAIHDKVKAGDISGARALLPDERPYPLKVPLAQRIGACI